MGLTWAWVFWMNFGRFVCVVWVGFGGTVVRMLFRWLHCRRRSKSWRPAIPATPNRLPLLSHPKHHHARRHPSFLSRPLWAAAGLPIESAAMKTLAALPPVQSLQKHNLHKVYPRFAARFLRMVSCGAEQHSGCRFSPESYSEPVEYKGRCARCERRLGRFRIVGPCERSQPTRKMQSWRRHGAGGAEQR